MNKQDKIIPLIKKGLKEALAQRANKCDCRTDGTTAIKWGVERKKAYRWLFIVWKPWRCVLGIAGHPPILFPLPVHQDRNQDESQRAEAFVTCKTHSQCSKEHRRRVFFVKVDVRAPCLCSRVSHFIVRFNPWKPPVLLYCMNATICRVAISHFKSFSDHKGGEIPTCKHAVVCYHPTM